MGAYEMVLEPDPSEAFNDEYARRNESGSFASLDNIPPTETDGLVSINGAVLPPIPVTPAYVNQTKYEIPVSKSSKSDGFSGSHDSPSPYLDAVQIELKPHPTLRFTAGDHTFLWEPCQAPEGNLYFRDTTKNILTLLDLYEDHYLEAVSRHAAFLVDRASRMSTANAIPTDIEIVIATVGEDHSSYGYYCITWRNESVFWLEKVPYSDVATDMVCLGETHIKKHLERLFWMHIETFPYDRGGFLCESALRELNTLLNFGAFDKCISRKSTFVFEKDTTSDILACLGRIDATNITDYDRWIIARCKSYIAEYEFDNYHGQRGARVQKGLSTAKDSVAPEKWSLFFRITSRFPLFSIPRNYLTLLEKTSSVELGVYTQHLASMENIYQQSTVPATVMLSANVGLLALQPTSDSSGWHVSNTLWQVPAYISSFLALVNILMVQSHIIDSMASDPIDISQSTIITSVDGRRTRRLKLENRALLLSMAPALMIWSVLTFEVALVVQFDMSSWTTSMAFMAVSIILPVAVYTVYWFRSGSGVRTSGAQISESLHRHVQAVQRRWKARPTFNIRRPRHESHVFNALDSTGDRESAGLVAQAGHA